MSTTGTQSEKSVINKNNHFSLKKINGLPLDATLKIICRK